MVGDRSLGEGEGKREAGFLHEWSTQLDDIRRRAFERASVAYRVLGRLFAWVEPGVVI